VIQINLQIAFKISSSFLLIPPPPPFIPVYRHPLRSHQPGDGYLPTGRIGESGSQDLYTILRHQERVLELGTQLAVGSGTGPLIRPGYILVSAQVDHRLDGKAHSWLCYTYRLVLCIVRYVGVAMEELVDALTIQSQYRYTKWSRVGIS